MVLFKFQLDPNGLTMSPSPQMTKHLKEKTPSNFSCEVAFLGKSSLNGGSLSSKTLSNIVDGMIGSGFSNEASTSDNHLLLEWNKKGLQTMPAKMDEGFESDADSTRSSDTSDSSAVVVRTPTSTPSPPLLHSESNAQLKSGHCGANSLDDTSSANSSGSGSDTDEQLGEYKSLPFAQCTSTNYSLSNILFCHTDPQRARVVVCVLKVPPTNSLQALVFECPDAEVARKFYETYHELSQKARFNSLYRNHRRKTNIGLESAFASNEKLLNSLEAEPSNRGINVEFVNQQPLPPRIPAIVPHDVRLRGGSPRDPGSGIGKPTEKENPNHISVISLDGSNVPQPDRSANRVPTKFHQRLENILAEGLQKRREATSETGHQPSNVTTVRHNSVISITSSNNVDTYNVTNLIQQDIVPQRPQRGIFVNRSQSSVEEVPPPPPRRKSIDNEGSGKPNLLLVPLKSESENKYSTYPKEPHVFRGKFIRVVVNHNQQLPDYNPDSQPTSLPDCSSLIDLSNFNRQKPAPNPRPVNNLQSTFKPHEKPVELTQTTPMTMPRNLPRPTRADIRPSSVGIVLPRRERSFSGTNTLETRRRSRSQSPPRLKPMAYRYIDINTPQEQVQKTRKKDSLSHFLTMKSRSSNAQSVRPILNSMFSFGSNSESKAPPVQPKSVMRKSGAKPNSFSKRVTFSAYAIVQVVDC